MSDHYRSLLSMADTIMMQAYILAQVRSKDPRCKVGAAVYDPLTTDCYFGYNGFPTGVADTKERWDNRDKADPHSKFGLVRHAEANAVDKAQRALGADVCRCQIFITHLPCHRCIVDHVSSCGINQVIYADPDSLNPVTIQLCEELDIQLIHKPITKEMLAIVRSVLEPTHED